MLATLGASNATAFTVESMEIDHTGDTYAVAFEVTVAADSVKARNILTNYAKWPSLSDNIIESRLVDVLPSGTERISVTFRSCIIASLFCKVIRQVKDLDRLPDGNSYITTLVPGQADFASGSERWQIQAEGKDKTRLRYDATLVLAFRVPPLIGPWLLKRALRRELIGTANKLEQLVAH